MIRSAVRCRGLQACRRSGRGLSQRCAASSAETTPRPPPEFRRARRRVQSVLTSPETIRQLQGLAREALDLAIQTGPGGVVRGLQAGRSVLELAQEVAVSGTTPEPEVLTRKLFEKLGATYIKLGQFIASSPSLFPPEFVREFQKCLDATDPVPFDAIKRRVDLELNGTTEQVFSFIDPKPLASASVAQVHAAQLRGSNKLVVIKVLKPGVENVLTTDLNFLYLSVKLIQILNPELERTSIAGIVEDIRTSMLDEVDFRKEAANLKAFSAYLDKMGLGTVATCPFVYEQHSGSRVLVMERLDGVALTDLDAIRAYSRSDPEVTLINALNTWAGSLLHCETFHADVHAGNLLVLRDGRVAFIDFGIVGRISPTTWRAIDALVVAFAVGDYVTMARALATMKATDAEVDLDALAKDLQEWIEELQKVQVQIDEVVTEDAAAMSINVDGELNEVLLRAVQIGETHGIRFPREFGLLLKQALYFDRYQKILAPRLEVFRDDRVAFRGLADNDRGGPTYTVTAET